MTPFTKMHGIGNDFVFIDAIREPLDEESIEGLACSVNDRRFGIGGDGLILAETGTKAPFRMRMFNPDGSAAEMCGNGVRCLGRFLIDKGHAFPGEIPIEVGDRVVELRTLADGTIRVDMGHALLKRSEIGMLPSDDATFVGQPVEMDGTQFSGTAVSMGNPHLVLIVDSVDEWDLSEWGSRLEYLGMFPERVNVHFVQVLDRARIIQRTWERGAGITLACGSGACSSAVATVLNGFTDRTVEVQLPGGNLIIEYAVDGTVFMTGPVATVFEGTWP